MPARETQRGSEKRGVAIVHDRHQAERFPRVGKLVLQCRENRRVAVEPEEKRRTLRRLQLKPPIIAERGKSVGPNQLDRRWTLGNAPQFVLVEAKLIGTVDART